MRRSRRLSWPQLVAAFALLAASAAQAQRLTEIPSGAPLDQGVGCTGRFCSAIVSDIDGSTAIMTSGGAGVMIRSAPEVWELQQELWNPDDAPGAPYPVFMGAPASVSGDTLLLTGSSRIYNFAPVIYVWQRSRTTWAHTQVLAPPRPAGFDTTTVLSVKLHQKTAAVCSTQHDTAANRTQVQVDLYVLQSNGRFQRQAQVIPPVPLGSCSIALEGNTLVVPAPLADQQSGRVLVYERGSSGWILRRQLTASDRSPGALFGASVDISGNTIVAGAPGRPNFDQPRHPGAVYLFQRTATGWAQTQLLVKPVSETDPPIPEETDPVFGGSVSVSGDRLVTSWAAEVENNAALPQTYLYERRGVWAPVAGLMSYPELSTRTVLLSGSVAIQTANIRVSVPHELPPLWTLPPRVEGLQ